MPYTYRVKFQKDGTTLHYYGVRYAANAEPSDLGRKYFTSSKTVKNLIKEHGLDCFVFQVRRVFDDAGSAVAWEQKVLRRMRVLQREDWLNQSIGTTHRAAEPRSPEHAQRISSSLKNRVVSKETREKISESRRGKKLSEETRQKMREQRKGRVYISHIETETTKLVTTDEIQSYLDQGWVRGRKFGVKKGPRHTEKQREKWSNERKGKKVPAISKARKGMVSAIDSNGNKFYVTKEEFDIRDDLFGIRNAKVAHLV